MADGDRSEENPREALEDAAHKLGRVLGAIQEGARGSLTLRQDGEARVLRDWARARGLILDPWEYLDRAKVGGEEHLIYDDRERARVIKLTKPNAFGFTIGAEWFFDDGKDEADFKPALRGATPLEYLERLRLHNAVFGDRIELLGIVDKRQALHVVTSQPTIRGAATPNAEIVWFMRQLGFVPLPQVGVGRLGALAFLRDSDGMAAFDCHPANFLTCDGDVFPIDVILVRVGEELRAALPIPP